MRRLGLLTAALAIIAAACSAAVGDTSSEPAAVTTTATTAAPSDGTTTTPPDDDADEPTDDTVADGNPTTVELSGDLAIVAAPWPTNWAKRSIELDELLIGLGAVDPRDLIRPIDDPVYEDVTSASAWLEDPEQGILLEVAGEAIF